MLGDFRPGRRDADLHERLEQYYRDTPDSMSNRDALPHWKAFRQWCDARGYTADEITRAKRHVRVQPPNVGDNAPPLGGRVD